MMAVQKSSFSSPRLDELRKLAADKGMSVSQLIDHYASLGTLLENRVKKGKVIYAADPEAKGERELIPVKEFLRVSNE